MSPLVFSLTVCGVLLAFCRWGPWNPPPSGTPTPMAPLASGAWLGAFISTLRAISGRGGVGGLGPPSPDYTSRGRLSLVCGAWPCMPDRWVRRRGAQPRRKLRCLFGRWPREDIRAEKAATSEPLRCGLWTGLREERLFDQAFGRERSPAQGPFLGEAGVHWPEFRGTCPFKRPAGWAA